MSREKILVHAPNWIGDQILAYPFFLALRAQFPDAWIAAACRDWVAELQFQDCVDQVIVLSKGSKKGDKKPAALQESWDLGICLPTSFSSAWLFFRSRVGLRRGFKTDFRSLLLNDSVAFHDDPVEHRSKTYLRLLPKPLDPSFSIHTSLLGFQPENAWPKAQPIDPESLDSTCAPYWLLAPGSQASSRQWPIEHYLSLAQRVYQETKWKAWVLGGQKEVPLVQTLVQRAPEIFLDLTKRCTPADLWKVFKRARFLVCNDSGLAHLGALCSCPVLVVWGAADPKRTHPLGPAVVYVETNPVLCWPCEKNICAQKKERQLDCLKGIHPDAIWNHVRNRFLAIPS